MTTPTPPPPPHRGYARVAAAKRIAASFASSIASADALMDTVTKLESNSLLTVSIDKHLISASTSQKIADLLQLEATWHLDNIPDVISLE